MAKTAFDASRIAAFTFDPDDLVLITDEKHPLYDARVKLPLKPEFVANVSAMGVIEPVVVRKIDGQAVVIDGRQRVRAAREANKQRAKEGLPLIKIPAVERKGGAGDAFAVTVATNEHRQDDPLRAKIEKAQRLHQLGRSEEEIAVDFGATLATIKRWLDANPKERGPRKKRAVVKRPSARVVAHAAKAAVEVESISPDATLTLGWVSGTVTDDEFYERFPVLRPEPKAAAKKAA